MTPISTADTRPAQLTVLPGAPALDALVPVEPQPTHYLVCDDCDLSSGPMAAAEAEFLSRIHDQLQHRGCPTARVDDHGPAEERKVA